MGEGIFVISGTEPLSCPICGGNLAAYDRKTRKVHTRSGGKIVLLLRRLRCTQCKKLHTELPDFLLPYKRYSRKSIEDVLSGSRTGAPDDERNRGKIRRWYRQIRSYLDGIWKRLVNQTLASPKKTHTLQKNIETIICHESSHTLTAIDKRLTELQAELLKLASSKADYEKVGDEIYRLREEKQKAQVENLGRDELQKRITDMSSFLQEQPTALTEYDEALVRRLIEKVTVYEDKFIVEFKSGLMVDVNE